MSKTDDFFIPENEVRLPQELDYRLADEYIRCAKAFSRSTYHSVYIIDYFKKNFLYVSPNPMFLCGLTPEEMMALGYGFYLKYVPEDEQWLLKTVNDAGFSFLHTLPVEGRADYDICYDFHIINNGTPILINHKLTPLSMTSDGRIWLALCIVSASVHSTAGHIEVHQDGTSDYFEYSIRGRRWIKRSMPRLSDGEKAMLTLSIQGLTVDEISDRLCRSRDTIKKYRRLIFEKLEVHNISEAIVKAINWKLL